MISISIEDLQRDPKDYIQRVEQGETLIITRANRPVAEVKPVAPPEGGQPPFGLCAGEFTVPDDFDAPLPEELLRQFEGA